MSMAITLPPWGISGALAVTPDPGPAAGIWYAQWALAVVPIALGLVFHLLTLLTAFVFIRDCIRKGRFNRSSGLPVVGPIFISLGLWWSPTQGAAWLSLIPWPSRSQRPAFPSWSKK